jgi:hypothetical protein
MAMLRLKAARDRAPSRDGGSTWFMLGIELWHNLCPGTTTRLKCRIPDGKGESDPFSYSEL